MSYDEEISELREEINKLNRDIIDTLAKRVDVAQKIGEVKEKYGYPVVDKGREKKVYEQVKQLGAEHGLDEKATVKIFKNIIKLCTQVQVKE